jgi:DNA-binding PadR family transcriptional regulator
MSIKYGLLALLQLQPMYGAQLRHEFERRTGGTWPVNVGQIYTTLGRLERDGLVSGAGERAEEGTIAYRLTDAGADALAKWWASPVLRESAPRDELVVKLALAVSLPGVDVAAIVQTQRTATMIQLRDLTRMKAGKPNENSDDLTWELVLESLIFNAEAQLRWLDHVEGRLRRAPRQQVASAGMTVDPVTEARR